MKKQRNKLVTTQKIIEAAEDLFLEKGPSETSMANIAQRVGVAQSLICYYFDTKEKLWGEVIKRAFADLLEVQGANRKNRAERDPEEFLIEAIYLYYQAIAKDDRLRRFIQWMEILEMPATEEMLAAFMTDVEYVRSLQERGEMSKDVDPIMFLFSCGAMTEGMAHRRKALTALLPNDTEEVIDRKYLASIEAFVQPYFVHRHAVK